MDNYVESDSFRNYRPASNFYVNTVVDLPDSDVDFQTGELLKKAPRRKRTQARKVRMNELDCEKEKYMRRSMSSVKKKGRINIVAAWAIVGVVVFLGMTTMGIRYYQLDVVQGDINSVKQGKEKIKNEMITLQEEVNKATEKATIIYTASKSLGMIPASATFPIHLSVLDWEKDSAGEDTASNSPKTN